ncbi:GP3 protein [Kafue kinda chacma baboon virus]|uniref:GP3 protein n=1 Tax=Kafue kinda chacma baboon virus TaxID=1823757 RepID=A0A120HV21_9NIDO|nr:GP3 protein [Kafue kinda chacma baboon virus]AMB20716.1 GP3 protein [Kafue kinda chacma baboon virus]AMV49339.1 GP3 protein [Kafue kinda chacma baboon virus]
MCHPSLRAAHQATAILLFTLASVPLPTAQTSTSNTSLTPTVGTSRDSTKGCPLLNFTADSFKLFVTDHNFTYTPELSNFTLSIIAALNATCRRDHPLNATCVCSLVASSSELGPITHPLSHLLLLILCLLPTRPHWGKRVFSALSK